MSERDAANPRTDVDTLFAMVGLIKPLSLSSSHSKQGGAYQTDIRRIARGYAQLVAGDVAGSWVFSGRRPLYARIVHFHTYPKLQGDTDNIAKPLLDALCGVVYEDDRVIKRCVIDVVHFRGIAELDLSIVNVPERPAEHLLQVLTGEYPDVVYIEVGRLILQRLELGSIP